MPRRIAPDSSLETLKAEAKDWLKALRANDPAARARFDRALPNAPKDPSLRDVQLALARELGFPGWTALKERSASNASRPPAALAAYERMASNLLDAYRTGTPEAMERHWNDTWHRRTWQAMRTYVQLDLGKRPAVEGGDVEITLDDARRLVARDAGAESWAALAAQLATMPAGRTLLDKAVNLANVAPDGSVERVFSTRDWDEALEALRDGRANGLGGQGQLDDAMLDSVSRIERVIGLHLGGSSRLTNAGMRALARMPQLRLLDLSEYSGSDASLAVLGALESLAYFTMTATRVTDAGVAHLAGCNALERVNLAGSMTGDGALRSLGGKPRLHQLMTGRLVSDDGLQHLHAFPVFKEWQGGEVKLALLSPDAEPNQLVLRGTITDRGLSHLVGLDGLFALNIDDASMPVTGAGLAPLVALPHLGMLGFDAKDESMPYIAALPVLRFLMAQDTTASDDGFVALSASRSIEFIWGRRSHNLRRRGFEALARMPALRSLSVSCLNVDDAGLSSLPSFPALRELMPIDVPDDGYRHIGMCTELERLVLMYCRETGDVATSHIVGLPKLKSYFASYTKITDRTPELLSTMTALEELELQACPGVTNAGISALARSPSLRELRLSGMQNVTRDAVAGFPPRIHTHFSM